MERHQLNALLIFLVAAAWVIQRDGFAAGIAQSGMLFVCLLGILFYRVVAYFAGFGFMEYFARDFGSENPAGPYALFFWILFILATLFLLFDWQLY